MNSNQAKYIHDENTHNNVDPSFLVPLFIELFSPKSVCDVGCGIGNFLSFFRNSCVKKVLGYDGNWVNRNLLAKHLNDHEFLSIDFENTFSIPPDEKFDLVLNLEVAEHISTNKSDQLVDFLTSLSDTIIFSAAIPGQGGINHINEQWEEYWESKFKRRSFKKYDIIRHRIISNQAISWWYRQNIVVYSKLDLSTYQAVELPNIIMRENYFNKLIQLNKQG